MNETTKRVLSLIDELIKDKKLVRSERQFALAIGMQASQITGAKNGDREFPEKYFSLISEKFKVNQEYLLHGTGNKFKDETNAHITSEYPETIDLKLITISSRASFEYEVFKDETHPIEKVSVYKKNIKGLKKPILIDIDGDSMSPQLNHGTRVLADELDCSNWIYTTGVVAVSFNNQFVVKRIKENNSIETNSLTLHSDNPQGGSFIIKLNDINAMWKVIEIVKAKVE